MRPVELVPFDERFLFGTPFSLFFKLTSLDSDILISSGLFTLDKELKPTTCGPLFVPDCRLHDAVAREVVLGLEASVLVGEFCSPRPLQSRLP